MANLEVTLSPEQTIAITRAISEPRRFAILEQIASCDHIQCGALAQHEDVTPATISHHLRELTEAGLIESVREGRTMRLSLCRPVWNAYLARLQSL